MKKRQNPIKPKGKGNGIMVSGFLTPVDPLQVASHITDDELVAKNDWSFDKNGKPVRTAVRLFEYGKQNY